MITNPKELLEWNKELKISKALGIHPPLYEVTVYRKNVVGNIFKSSVYVGVAAVDVRHATAIITKRENDVDVADLDNEYADKLHYATAVEIDVGNINNVSESIEPVQQVFSKPDEGTDIVFWRHGLQLERR